MSPRARHRQRSEEGYALILAIILATVAILIGTGFMRWIRHDTLSANSSRKQLLAQSAARAGLADATEAILADYLSGYNTTPLTINKPGGAPFTWSLNAAAYDPRISTGAAPLPPMPTFLDGPWRTPFVSTWMPNGYDSDDNDPAHDNDARAENAVIGPLEGWYSSNFLTSTWTGNGCLVWDGRGHYNEYNFRNLSYTPPATSAVAFSNLAPGLPDRSAGMFFDDQFQAVAVGTTLQNRAAARYRLRYALGVTDLGGLLLANPTAVMNTDRTNPTNDYRFPSTAVQNAGHAWFNLTAAMPEYKNAGLGSRYGTPFREEHVFLGRGNTRNFDWNPPYVPGAASPFGVSFPGTPLPAGTPVTFPMMFRQTDYAFWGDFTPLWTGYGFAGNSNFCPVIYGSNNGSVANAYAGGISMPANPRGWYNLAWVTTPYSLGGRNEPALVSTNYGPSLSWVSHWDSVHGYNQMNDGYNQVGTPMGDGQYIEGMGNNLEMTMFGRGIHFVPLAGAAAYDGYQAKWNERKIRSDLGETGNDSPWLVNLLTASPRVVYDMVAAYLPPSTKTTTYTVEDYSVDGGNTWIGANAISAKVRFPQKDLQTSLAGPGFSEFPVPTTATTGAQPNLVAPDTRTPAQIYPGAYMMGSSLTANQGSDDLGKKVVNGAGVRLVDLLFTPPNIGNDAGLYSTANIGKLTFPRDPQTDARYVYIPDENEFDYDYDPMIQVEMWQGSNPVGAPPAAWFPTQWWYYYRQRNPTSCYMTSDSYWCDLALAFYSTVALARASWVQYPNVTTINKYGPFTVPTFNPASIGDPQNFDTLSGIDRWFLQQLGENYDHPGTAPAGGYVQQNDYNVASPSQVFTQVAGAAGTINSIKALVSGNLIPGSGTATSAERGKVMERMLNDFRMSFLGSSPLYRDPNNTADTNEQNFCPLDFDGDGQVQCSCYPLAGGYHQKAAGANGRGPRPTYWFSLTGAFTIQKSHFYRITARGEVYDTLLKCPASETTLDSALVVDPEYRPAYVNSAGVIVQAVADPTSTHTLYQRFVYDSYNGMLAHGNE
jgi:hypothetical protein